MFPDTLTVLAESVLRACNQTGLRLATAESCTGGLIAACLTAVAGSSIVVERGFVTYADEAKIEMLGVPAGLIQAQGAVNAAVAEAMAMGALARSHADVAVAVTGIAGPGGGTPTKPVGLVYIAAVRRGAAPRSTRHLFAGDRTAVRLATVVSALEMVSALVADTTAGKP